MSRGSEPANARAAGVDWRPRFALSIAADLERRQQLPGFDNEAFIEAMASAERPHVPMLVTTMRLANGALELGDRDCRVTGYDGYSVGISAGSASLDGGDASPNHRLHPPRQRR